MGLVEFVAQKNDPVVDSLNHTIVAFLKAGTDINNVAWSMDIDKNINITPMPEKVNNFSKPVCFVLTSVDGKESTSWTISVKVEKETSLFESGMDELKIWPNPAFNYLQINSEISIKKVQIANVCGQIVKTTVIKDGMINVAGITEGTYTLIVIKSDNTILYTHFVKLK